MLAAAKYMRRGGVAVGLVSAAATLVGASLGFDGVRALQRRRFDQWTGEALPRSAAGLA